MSDKRRGGVDVRHGRGRGGGAAFGMGEGRSVGWGEE